MAQSRIDILPTIMLCLLIIPLITLCAATNKNSSSKQCDNKGTQNVPFGYGAWVTAPGMPGMPGIPGPAGPAGVAGSPGPQGPTGPRGDRGEAGSKGSRGPLGTKGPQGEPGPRGFTGLQGSQGNTGKPGRQGTRGPRGLPGLGGNWKQCVFQNLNDGKDTGLIKECVFHKKSHRTGLRVFWSGPLRIYNCHGCCKRWYFTFNSVECSAPAAIDGVVYMVHGNGAKKDLHRVRQIEGVCERVVKGVVRVGFWVGDCKGVRSADAYTGWNSVSRIYVEEVPPPQA